MFTLAQAGAETQGLPAWALVVCFYSIYELTMLASGNGLRIQHSIAQYYSEKPSYFTYMIGFRSSFADAPLRVGLAGVGHLAILILIPYLVFVA